MKLLIGILLLAVCIQDIHAQTMDKKISIEATHISIGEVLNQLSSKYNIPFSYSTDYISLDSLITISRKNSTLTAILDEILLHQPIDYKIIANIVVFKNRNVIASKKAMNKNLPIPIAPLLSSRVNKRKVKEQNITIQTVQYYPIDSIRTSPLTSSQSPKKSISIGKTNQESISEKSEITVLEKSKERNEIDYRMARLIVQRAFGNIENNYHSNPLLFKGYYREIIEENKQVIAIIDAAIDIYDKGYKIKANGKKPREKIILRAVRANAFEIKESFKTDFLQFNSLAAILRWNKIKYPTQETEKIIAKSRYKIDSITESSIGMTYIVSTLLSSQTHELVITYHIDALTHSFVKVTYEDKAKNGHYLNQKWQFSNNRSHYFQAKQTLLAYEFERHEEKMYLSQYSEKSYADIYNNKNKSIEWEFGCSRSLRITDVKPWENKNKYDKAMDGSKALSEQITPYNLGIWEQFDEQKLIPISEDQLQKLESKTPLLQQFQDNSLGQEK